MSTVDQKLGYRYTNTDPDDPIARVERFDVLPIHPDDRKLKAFAFFFQKIMHDAWSTQFEGQLAPAEIVQTANHLDPKLVTAQTERLREEPVEGQPTYVRAEVLVSPVTQAGQPLVRQVIGVGKSKYAGQENEPRLADISDIYVAPDYQSRGVGTALTHVLLEGFPRDMRTVVYDFEFNTRLKPLLKQLGFEALKTWDAPYFGLQVPQTYYSGPLVGELKEILEKRSPWLKNRQPL